MKYLLIYYTITFSVTLYFFSIGHGMGALWDIRERKNMARRNWSPCMHSAWHWVMFFFRLPCLWWYYKTTWKWWQNRLFFLGPPLFIQRSQPTMAEKLYNTMSESAAAVYCVWCVLLVDIRADCFRIYLQTFLYKRRQLLTKDQTKHIKHQNSLCEMICCFVLLPA
jgi:hypothetical protein